MTGKAQYGEPWKQECLRCGKDSPKFVASTGQGWDRYSRDGALVWSDCLQGYIHPGCIRRLLDTSGSQNGIDYTPIIEIVVGYAQWPTESAIEKVKRKNRWDLR